MSIDLDKAAELARQLPPRQRAVLAGLADGKLRKEIASELKISHSTVNRHCEIIYKRLGLHTIGEAVRVALAARLV